MDTLRHQHTMWQCSLLHLHVLLAQHNNTIVCYPVHLPVSTGTLGDDMTEMMNHFVRGKTYLSTKDSDAVGKVEVNIGTVIMSTSSSPWAFPIIWCRRNSNEYNSSTLPRPVRPPPLTPDFPYLFYRSLST